jgi:hypothetical protein
MEIARKRRGCEGLALARDKPIAHTQKSADQQRRARIDGKLAPFI